MGTYVFECSVKEIVFEVSGAKTGKHILRLVPDVGFSSGRKDETGKMFVVFQPMGGTPSGEVFEYEKFVEMEIKGRGGSWLTNVGIGVESKLRIEIMDCVDAADGSKSRNGKKSERIMIEAPGKSKMAVTKIVIR